MAVVTYERGREKFYDLLLSLLLNSIFAIHGVKASRAVRANGGAALPIVKAGYSINLEGLIESLRFDMTDELLDALLQGRTPHEFSVERFPPVAQDAPRIISADVLGTTALIGAIFVNYYESVEDEIVSRYGPKSQHPNWPSVLQFARVVRNALAHDGGVCIADPKAPSVTWRGITVGQGDKGSPVLFHMLAAADVVLLMEDMDPLVR